MSIRIREKITCPKCGFQYEWECYPAVDGEKDPELKEKVLGGRAFVAVCPSCSVTTRLMYPCLYRDEKQGFAVYLLPRTEERSLLAKEKMEELLEGAQTEGLRLRLIDDYKAFREKIILFEEGYDDRAMEVAKAYMALAMMGGPKGGFVPETLYFQGLFGEDQMLMTALRGEESKQMTVPVKLYHEAHDRLKSRQGALDEGKAFEMIDLLWALEYLKKNGNIIDEKRN